MVFDAGAGGSSPDWALVREEVDQFATTIAYDRAGLGWSEPGPKPRTVLRQVAELRTALQRSGAEPPYVLVGHSWGGLVMRAYAYAHPGEVAGLVLVDAAHEDQFSYYPTEYVDSARKMGRMMRRMVWVGVPCSTAASRHSSPPGCLTRSRTRCRLSLPAGAGPPA